MARTIRQVKEANILRLADGFDMARCSHKSVFKWRSRNELFDSGSERHDE